MRKQVTAAVVLELSALFGVFSGAFFQACTHGMPGGQAALEAFAAVTAAAAVYSAAAALLILIWALLPQKGRAYALPDNKIPHRHMDHSIRVPGVQPPGHHAGNGDTCGCGRVGCRGGRGGGSPDRCVHID